MSYYQMKEAERKDKGLEERDHFKRRMLERYGIVVNQELYIKMRYAVLSKATVGPIIATFITGMSCKNDLYCLLMDRKSIFVLFDKHRKEFITALPPAKENERSLSDERASV